METIIGFVAGYLIGTREGKAGLERLKTSWHAISNSPEVRRLATDAISMAERVVRQVPGGISGAVVRTLASRGGGTRREPARSA